MQEVWRLWGAIADALSPGIVAHGIALLQAPEMLSVGFALLHVREAPDLCINVDAVVHLDADWAATCTNPSILCIVHNGIIAVAVSPRNSIFTMEQRCLPLLAGRQRLPSAVVTDRIIA